jgi:chemotaxis protein histidine kinase CheA/ActR/RegA family two-component response regulator
VSRLPHSLPPEGPEIDLRGLFLEEVEEHLRCMTDAQRALGGGPEGASATEAATSLLRHLHSLKGSAGSVGIQAIARAAHETEELCAEIRGGRLAVTAGILERLDEGLTTLRALVDGARSTPPGVSGVREPGAERRQAPGETGERRRAPDRRRGLERRLADEPTLRVEAGRLDALLDGVGDLVILGTRIERRVQELGSVLRDLRLTRAALRQALTEAGRIGPQPAEMRGRWLDRLTEVEVELASSAGHVDRATRALGGEASTLRRSAAELDEQLRRARLIPLHWAFQRLPHALRELERSTGKQAELEITGGEIEVDNLLCEQLGEALLHLLRNALAHGIEAPAVRLSQGKPARGRLTVSARQEDESILICFQDDGRGVDRERVRRALPAGANRTLDDQELLATLFQPGFSTRAHADDLAGRGMGLDIVKRAVTRLGGQVGMESHDGRGTRFCLTVPLSAAITEAVLFKVGGQVYAVPAAHVLQALPLPEALRAPTGVPSGTSPGRGPGVLPVLRLQALLGVEMPPVRRAAALLLRFGERSFFASCDKIIGPRTIVVRPLDPVLSSLQLYAGVTISGAGKAQLIFDLGALAEAAYSPARVAARTPRRAQPRVLVVDDSRLAREGTARALADLGFQTVTAEDGWEAWELLSERRFDALVTDLQMPRMDGLELIAKIRREPTLKALPVVVLSSRAAAHAPRAQALAAGADVVLPKSSAKRALADAVAGFVRPASAPPARGRLPAGGRVRAGSRGGRSDR